jgi:hypothetical protein
MKGMGFHPIPTARRRYLLAHLMDTLELFGNLTLAEVFAGSPSEHLDGVQPSDRIETVLIWPHCDALFELVEFTIFRAEIEKALWVQHQRRIEESLGGFARALDEGLAVAMAPEGWLSQDGHIGRIKSGLRQILARTERDVTLVPVLATHDFMTKGRSRMFVNIGEPLRDVKKWANEGFENEVARSLATLTTVTMGQAVTHNLRRRATDGQCEVSEGTLKSETLEVAEYLASLGLAVDDRLLEHSSFERRWRRFMAYCLKHKLLERDDSLVRFDPEQVLDAFVPEDGRASAWTYSANELDSLLKSTGKTEIPASIAPEAS